MSEHKFNMVCFSENLTVQQAGLANVNLWSGGYSEHG